MLRVLLCLLILNFTYPAYAFNLVGAWQLVSIERQNAQGQWQPDCHHPTGMIIYTASGDMATGLNCIKIQHNAPSFDPADTAFYVGTYHVKIILFYILCKTHPAPYIMALHKCESLRLSIRIPCICVLKVKPENGYGLNGEEIDVFMAYGKILRLYAA